MRSAEIAASAGRIHSLNKCWDKLFFQGASRATIGPLNSSSLSQLPTTAPSHTHKHTPFTFRLSARLRVTPQSLCLISLSFCRIIFLLLFFSISSLGESGGECVCVGVIYCAKHEIHRPILRVTLTSAPGENKRGLIPSLHWEEKSGEFKVEFKD